MIDAKQLFDRLISEISNIYELSEARSIVFLILEHFLNLSKIDILTHKQVPENQIDWPAIIARLQQNEPVQYIIGETVFYGHTFKVSPAVLIPRPETEELVALAITSVDRPSHVLDIGTGSGCIAVSIKKELCNSQVFAWDISEEALKIARQNADLNGTKIRFEQVDVLQIQQAVEQKFDLVVSNPPYIARAEASVMHANVLAHEPHLALFVEDTNPLIFYEKIAEFCTLHLSTNGCCIVEINEAYGKETQQLFEKKGFIAEILNDFHNKNRFVKASF